MGYEALVCCKVVRLNTLNLPHDVVEQNVKESNCRQISIELRIILMLMCLEEISSRDQPEEELGEISDSHGGKYEDDCLLGCCAV
jgi:hypothetical protein